MKSIESKASERIKVLKGNEYFDELSDSILKDVAEYMHMHFEVVPETLNGEKAAAPLQASLSQISEAGEGEAEV